MMHKIRPILYILSGVLLAWACAAPMGDDPGVAGVKAQAIVPCNLVQIDGKSVNNNTATLNMKSISLYNTNGHAFSAVSTGGGGSGMIVRGDIAGGGPGMYIEGFDGLLAIGNGAGSGITGRAGEGGLWNGAIVPGAAFFADGATKGGGIGFMINSGVLNGVGQPGLVVETNQTVSATGVYIKSKNWPALHLAGDFHINGANLNGH